MYTGTLGAEAGTLTFMVGSPTLAQFESVRDSVLKHMGKNIVHCGQVGNGQVAKICNNMMLGISMIAASETMNLGVRLGERGFHHCHLSFSYKLKNWMRLL
jgi:3-hydroxyisobutyrate dehydrogenase